MFYLWHSRTIAAHESPRQAASGNKSSAHFRSWLEPSFLGYDVRSQQTLREAPACHKTAPANSSSCLPQDSSSSSPVACCSSCFRSQISSPSAVSAYSSSLQPASAIARSPSGSSSPCSPVSKLGLDSPAFATQLRVLSDIFLRLIKVIVAPLILGTLITGIAGHGDLRKVGRIGWKSLLYFEAVTTVALFLGVAAINLTKAGEGLVIPATASAQSAPEVTPLRWTDFLLHIFPENIAKSVAENQILQVAVFAILFAIAVTRVPEHFQKPILSFAESLTQVMFRFTNLVMYFAPIGVGAAMAYTVGHRGYCSSLSSSFSTAYGALIAFLLFVLC
jgi:hypothetical protein